MKSEHRHELAENDLSKLLSRWGAEFDKHANTLLTVLIVVTLIAAGVIYWTRSSAATSALGWTDLANAASAEDFQNVAETYAGTPVAPWATLRAADGFLEEGIRLSLTDRPASNERLQQAKDSYEALLNNSSVPKEIREQVLIGYAVTLETLSDGDTSDAVAAYEKLLSEFERTRFRAFAEDRIADLKTGGTQDFYAWFHRLDPKPPDIPLPQDQAQFPRADDLSNLLPELGGSGVPETPPLVIPETEGDDAGNADVNPFAAQQMQDKTQAEQPESVQTPASDAPPSTPNPARTPQGEAEAPPASSETPTDAPSGASSEGTGPAEPTAENPPPDSAD